MILMHKNEKAKDDPIAFLHLELPPFIPSKDVVMLFNFLKSFDKRQYPRRFLNLPIQYYLPDKMVGHSGSTVNISEEGLAVELPEKLEVGQTLQLSVYDNDEGIIGIFAKVVWVNLPGRKGELHRCGMSISKLSIFNRCKWKILLAYANA
jgi:hypothetical protein